MRSNHRLWVYLICGLFWLLGTLGIGVPVLAGLAGVLNQLDLAVRIVFYVMPAAFSALLVLGVLQIIAMYRYWFGPRQ